MKYPVKSKHTVEREKREHRQAKRDKKRTGRAISSDAERLHDYFKQLQREALNDAR
jgi:hypothetical protein